MPLVLFSRQITDNAILGVWHATETRDEMVEKAGLTASESAYLWTIRLEKRQREWLAARILLRMMGKGAGISALPNGKPVLNSNHHISISHSQDLAALVIAQSPVGLDIQGEDPKLLRIARKYTNSRERLYLPEGDRCLPHLTLIWSAKEAVFKFFGEQVDFSNDIYIAPFRPDDDMLKAEYNGIHGVRSFDLHVVRYQQVNLVITSQQA